MKVITELPEYSWSELIDIIGMVVAENDFCQPIKPYLSFPDPSARIIAMPAAVGGSIRKAGIKWISSFPENHNKGLPRAHSVLILNDYDTGVPLITFNTAELSALRTAAVTGYFLHQYMMFNEDLNSLGIIGYGPIGQCHESMIQTIFPFVKIMICDQKHITNSKWETYTNYKNMIGNVDGIITCTAGSDSNHYIEEITDNIKVFLNISLRDMKISKSNFEYFDRWVVDSWDEVNRHGTDFSLFEKNYKFNNEQWSTLFDMDETFLKGKICFNPMGMACFDIAIASYFLNKL